MILSKMLNVTGLLVGSGFFRDKFVEKMANFAGIFEANFAEKQSKKTANLLGVFWANFAGKRLVFALI